MIKKWRGGKRRGQMRVPGQPGENDAGIPRFPNPGKGGVQREFEGSKFREYTFSDEIHGTRTIVAESYAVALRIAKSLGFSKRDYQKKRKRR